MFPSNCTLKIIRKCISRAKIVALCPQSPYVFMSHSFHVVSHGTTSSLMLHCVELVLALTVCGNRTHNNFPFLE